METVRTGGDVLFILIGAVMVLAMHAGFAFLELGTVRAKNQVNALAKIMTDFAISTIAYFFVGYWIAYGVNFFSNAAALQDQHGYALVKFFFLLTFAAAIPAIVSGGIAERARFNPQLLASLVIVGLLYPFFEGLVWNGNHSMQTLIEHLFGAPFHDFAGSIVVHAVGGWIGLAAVLLLERNLALVPDTKHRKQDVLIYFGLSWIISLFFANLLNWLIFDPPPRPLPIVHTLRFYGLTFYWGLIAFLLLAFVFLKIAKYQVNIYLNELIPSITIFHAFGRTGCSFVGCCFGSPNKPIAITFLIAGFCLGCVLVTQCRVRL